MKTRTLYAVAPDGTIVTRRTHRDYSHAILVRGSAEDTWGAWSFHGTIQAAQREFSKAQRAYGHRVVCATVSETKPEPEVVEAISYEPRPAPTSGRHGHFGPRESSEPEDSKWTAADRVSDPEDWRDEPRGSDLRRAWGR